MSFFARLCGSGLPTTHFATNKVTNTKYTFLSFIPINLYDQFSRFMNQYFLFIAALQLWRDIVIVHPALNLVPLIFILTLSAVKEAIDDYYRYQSDKQANERQFYVVRQGEKRIVQSQDLRVGDIIWLRENEEIPCDVMLIATPDPSGSCYIQTTNLDGESDLKMRQALQATASMSQERIHRFRGVIECPVPNAEIYKWDARIRLTEEGQWLSLSDRQMLLAATNLRNCEWAYGIVVYTGNETKVGKNKRVPVTKYTATDNFINRLSMFIFGLQLSLVIVLAIAGWVVQVKERKDLWYISQGGLDFLDWLVIPLRFVILMSIMIPISLKVTQDIMKFGSAKIINWDEEMRDPVTGRAEAKNTAISDDLGQIEIVFSDKTGTLTENRMAFVKCTINGQAYGFTSQHPNALYDPALQRAVDSRDAAVMDFWRVLALCHSVVPYERRSQGELRYRASSPDEKALVDAARAFKVTFMKRTQQGLEINVVGTQEGYQLLNVLDFTSDRKRMSVILRNAQTGVITLLMKGADDMVLARLRSRNQTVETTVSYVETFAKIGLRTLCIACKEVTEQEYSEWAARLQEAQTLMQGRDQRVAEVYDMIEHNLVLIGATAIEDKLQEAVPETIGILRRAGCKVWMLTGDKYSTAIQIAGACNLISAGTDANLLTVSGVSAEDIKRSVEDCVRRAHEMKAERKVGSMIIEGNILKTVLAHYSGAFTELCLLVNSVICCRVTPEQKGQVVALCKSRGLRTLAIGDGGNDVPMIQEAHVGIGIRGEEGMQAARAADYTIGRFKFLARLMLIHGRYSYKRTAFASQYMFYKSSFLCFVQVYYAFLTKVSGSAFFSEYSQTMYNIIYTSLPVLFFLLDKDVSEDAVYEYPELYGESQRGENLNILTFGAWLLRSVVQSLLLMGVLIKTYGPDYIGPDGTGNTYDITQVAAYTAIIIVQCCTMALETHFFTLLNHVAIWGTLALYFTVTVVYVPHAKHFTFHPIGNDDNFLNAIHLYSLVIPPTWDDYFIFAHALGEAQFWAIIGLLVISNMGPVFIIKYLKNEYWPAHYVSVRRWEKERRSSSVGRSPSRTRSMELGAVETGGFGDASFHTLKPEVSNESLKSPLLQD